MTDRLTFSPAISADATQVLHCILAGAVSGRQVARECGVNYTTLTSRFHRAGLSVGAMIDAWQLMLVARQLHNHPNQSVAWVSRVRGFSSPQSLHRFIQRLTGHTASAWRTSGLDRYTVDAWVTTWVESHIGFWRTLTLCPIAPVVGAAA